MEIDRAAGVLVALQHCSLDEAVNEILDASRRHRVPPVSVARALVALAEGVGQDDDPSAAAARYEWGLLLKPEVVSG
jgi:hypothetical protein